MKNIKSNGLSINTSGDESKQPVIFVHAFPLCCRMWDEQVKFFQDDYYVITYDLRTFGYSETGNYVCPIERHAEDLLSLISEMSFAAKPVVCGLSMGGYVILRAVQIDSSPFKALILSDTKSGADTDEARIKRFAQIKQIREDKMEEYTEGFLNAALSNSTDISIRGFLKEMISWQDKNSIQGALLALAARTDTTAALKDLKIPVLFLSGKDDKIITADVAESMHKTTPGSNFNSFEESGHFPNLEKPFDFNNAILNFIKSL